MRVDITNPGMQVDLTLGGESVDILRLIEQTAQTVAMVISDNDGTKRDITGYAFKLGIFTIREGSADALKTFQSPGDFTITDATLGEVDLIVGGTDLSVSHDQSHAYGELSAYSGGSVSGTVTDRAEIPVELLLARNS